MHSLLLVQRGSGLKLLAASAWDRVPKFWLFCVLFSVDGFLASLWQISDYNFTTPLTAVVVTSCWGLLTPPPPSFQHLLEVIVYCWLLLLLDLMLGGDYCGGLLLDFYHF